MSDGITGELRDTLKRAKCTFTNSAGFEQVNVTKAALDSMLDAIDAIHANLERENDRLRCELDRVQGDRDGLIELPKDADGVPIRVGDLIRSTFVGEVLAIELRKDGWHVHTDQWSGHDFNTMHHVQSDSWGRIIEDVRRRTSDYYCNNIPCNFQEMAEEMVARCNALCACTNGGDAE